MSVSALKAPSLLNKPLAPRVMPGWANEKRGTVIGEGGQILPEMSACSELHRRGAEAVPALTVHGLRERDRPVESSVELQLSHTSTHQSTKQHATVSINKHFDWQASRPRGKGAATCVERKNEN